MQYSIQFDWKQCINSYLNINILENNETLNSTIKNFADFYISSRWEGSLHKTYNDYINISKGNNNTFLLYHIDDGEYRSYGRYYASPSYRPQIICK